MITNGFSSASASSSTYAVPDYPLPPSQIPLANSAQATASSVLDSAVANNSPRQQLQQFVTVLFQALEQNQTFIQQQREEMQARAEQAKQAKQQNPYTSDKPPLVKDLESLVTRLSDKSSNNNGKGNATPQLQQLYQETPLRSAYPNLPLGSMLQALEQSLDSSNPDSLPHQGTLLDTQT